MTTSQEQSEILALAKNKGRMRIIFYTHDTYGLGHVRRCMHIISRLAQVCPKAPILLVTGSPALHYLKNLPRNADIVKIPTMVKTGDQGSTPGHLPIGLPELTLMRSRIVSETALAFCPDIFVVDNFPLGAQSELLPVLQALKGVGCRCILGLRDILDEPGVVKSTWKRQGVYDVIERYYDKVLVYGDPNIFDAVKEYDIPQHLAGKISHCGYLTATDAVPSENEEIRKRLGIDGKFILATGGGGGDAYPLLSTLIEAVDMIPDSKVLIFMGPLMGDKDRKELEAKIKNNSKIILREFVSDIRPYMTASDVVVSMCGYNIAAEIVYHSANAVVAPRTWRFGEHVKRKDTSEEKEQIMRAQFLAKYGAVSLVEPDQLSAKTLADAVNQALGTPKKGFGNFGIAVDGLQNAIKHICGACDGR